MTDEKGALVGSIDGYVIRRGNSNEHNVVTTISIGSLDLNPSAQYIVEVVNERGPAGCSIVGEFKPKTSKDGNNITLPTSFIEQHDVIRPGQTVNLKFYEYHPSQDEGFGISDDSKILGRSEVTADPSVSDGCDARLTSKTACESISSGGEPVKFRNTRNQKETVIHSHSDFENSKNNVSFPMEARRPIDAQPGDLIEIIRPASDEVDNDDKEQEELIRETHRMVSEMYDAYLEQVNE